MSKTIWKVPRSVGIAAIGFCFASALLAGAYTNQADIKVRSAATSEGVLVFKFQPKGGLAREIEIEVTSGLEERAIAHAIQVAFDKAVGLNYRVTWHNNDKLTIKKGGKRRFHVSLVETSAHGVDIRIDYD